MIHRKKFHHNKLIDILEALALEFARIDMFKEGNTTNAFIHKGVIDTMD